MRAHRFQESWSAALILGVVILSWTALGAPNTPCDVGPSSLSTAFGENIPRSCIDTRTPIGRRCFYSYIPPKCAFSADEPVPMMFDMHGLDICALVEAALLGWKTKAEENCFVVVWPQANTNDAFTSSPCWGLPGGITVEDDDGTPFDSPDCCCSSKADDPSDFLPYTKTDDPTVLRLMIDAAITDVAKRSEGRVVVDRSRVYMSGHSNGCTAATSMGVIHSDVVAAVCCLSGVLLSPFGPGYVPTPMFFVHGTEDTVLTYNERIDYARKRSHLGATGTLQRLGDAHGCRNFEEERFDESGNQGYVFKRTGCARDADVALLALEGVGHSTFYSEEGGVKIDTTQMAWDFCSSFTLDGRREAPPKARGCVEARDATFTQDRLKSRKRKCRWILRRKATQRKKRYCQNMLSDARHACPITCGFCDAVEE